jgi:hypothetical protein
MQSKVLITAIVVIGIFALAGYIYLNNGSNSTLAPLPTPAVVDRTQNADSEAVSELQQGGSSFTDPENIFALLYPNDYIQDTQGPNQFRFYKQGPTQTGQTEVYDGIIINIETINLGEQNLSDWVDSRITSSTQDGTSEIVKEKSTISVNGYPGYSYTLRGLGEFETLVVQKDQDSNFAIGITTLIADPGNLGFEQEFKSILSTLNLLN